MVNKCFLKFFIEKTFKLSKLPKNHLLQNWSKPSKLTLTGTYLIFAYHFPESLLAFRQYQGHNYYCMYVAVLDTTLLQNPTNFLHTLDSEYTDNATVMLIFSSRNVSCM